MQKENIHTLRDISRCLMTAFQFDCNIGPAIAKAFGEMITEVIESEKDNKRSAAPVPTPAPVPPVTEDKPPKRVPDWRDREELDTTDPEDQKLSLQEQCRSIAFKNHNAPISEQVDKILKTLKITGATLGEWLGVSKKLVSNVRNGRPSPAFMGAWDKFMAE